MAPAASAMAWRPLEQKRLMVMRARLIGQPAEEAGDARDVEPLLALGHGAAEDEILDVRRLDLRDAREERRDDLARELVRTASRASEPLCARPPPSEPPPTMTMSVMALRP